LGYFPGGSGRLWYGNKDEEKENYPYKRDEMDSEAYFLWGIAVGIGLCIVSFSIVYCLMDRLEEWWYRHRRGRKP